MNDLYKNKNVSPMLISTNSVAFDDPKYAFELELDGERCIAYLDPKQGTELRNKRNVNMLLKLPELAGLHKHVKTRCVLDGELIIPRKGKSDFSLLQRRSRMSNTFKIALAAKVHPASFWAFDILYYKNSSVTGYPLTTRKKMLFEATASVSPRFTVSRHVDTIGTALFEAVKYRDLQGVIGKRKGSLYYPGTRTDDWVKVKNLQDDDFVVCGYIYKDHHMISLILGQYDGDTLMYKGHVPLSTRGASFKQIQALPAVESLFHLAPEGSKHSYWVKPVLVCTVQYADKTSSGSMLQPVFKGLREDKLPEDCQVNRIN